MGMISAGGLFLQIHTCLWCTWGHVGTHTGHVTAQLGAGGAHLPPLLPKEHSPALLTQPSTSGGMKKGCGVQVAKYGVQDEW